MRFALNGEWAVGSMLVAETWPARLRGLVLSVDRSAWGVGAALAGTIVTFVVTVWGWRAAFLLPVGGRVPGGLCPADMPGIALLGAHAGSQATHPERMAADLALSADDQAWIVKTEKPGWRQLFLPDLLRNTVMATFVASMALVSYSTVGLWMPLFLAQQHHWSTAEYGSFYIGWALFSTTGLLGRRLDDRSSSAGGSASQSC